MEYLTNLNLNKNEIQNARAQNLATAPENPAEGQFYFNTTDKTLYVYAGGAWKNALYNYAGVTFTSALKTKLDGIAAGATKVEKSSINGSIKINGADTPVYVHPAGTNPHGTTKSDIGLGNVENKSAATILNELTKAKIVEKLGFTPKQIDVGLDSDKGTATGSKRMYIATDTKKIWLDNASGVWLQAGGQDTISWSNVTGKPSAFTPPVATASRLGGIKVGDNLKITSDGVLSAITAGGDGEHVFLIKQQRYTATAKQTDFTITNGSYPTGAGLLSVYLNGAKLSQSVITELTNTSFRIPEVSEGTTVLAEYIQVMTAEAYAAHSAEHVEGATDAIPNATQSVGGLLSAADKKKLDGIAEGANKYTHPTGAGNKHIPAGGAAGQFLKWSADGTAVWAADNNTTYGLATAAANGLLSKEDFAKLAKVTATEMDYLHGVTDDVQTQLDGKAEKSHGNHVPAVQTADARKFLRNDNTWQSLPAGTTGQTGIVQLNDAVNSTSTTQAATANAVKKAYDKGNHSHPYIPANQKGAAGGVAELDADGKVPAAQLPSYVDDVLEGYLSGGKFYEEDTHTTEITAESGKIYVDLDTGKTYRWSGTAYTIISDTIALGETSATAYPGNKGKVAYDHSQLKSGNPHGVTKANVGLGNVPNVATNDQTATYTEASALAALTSGEKLSVAMGKIAKAVSSLISHLADNVKHITAAERTSWNARTKKYSTSIGNGSATEFTVTHSLGTQDVTVLVRETASPYNVVFCDVQIISTTQIKLLFAAAPASNKYRVIVTG